MRPPVWRESVAPPGVRELAELAGADRLAGLKAVLFEPSSHVLFRPEEVHRASGEDDVVPPVRGRNEAVEQERPVVRPLVSHLDLDRLATVGTRRLDPAVRL